MRLIERVHSIEKHFELESSTLLAIISDDERHHDDLANLIEVIKLALL